MRERTPELRELFPCARIIEFYGASETSFIAWMEADEHAPPQVVGKPFGNVQIGIRNPRESDGAGLIYVRSPMLFMDYAAGATDATSALRDGEWLSVRDLGRLDEAGRLHLLGRENRMIVTQGNRDRLANDDTVRKVLAHWAAWACRTTSHLPWHSSHRTRRASSRTQVLRSMAAGH